MKVKELIKILQDAYTPEDNIACVIIDTNNIINYAENDPYFTVDLYKDNYLELAMNNVESWLESTFSQQVDEIIDASMNDFLKEIE